MPSSRSAFCLFCDDIRLELGNKPSFMGIYTGEMIFPPNPPAEMQIAIPKFCIITWLFCDKDDPPRSVTVRIFGPPGRTEFAKFEVPPEQLVQPAPFFDDVTKLVFQTALPMLGFPIACEGIIEVTAETDRETLLAGRLRVRVPGRPDPTLTSAEPAPPPSPARRAKSVGGGALRGDPPDLEEILKLGRGGIRPFPDRRRDQTAWIAIPSATAPRPRRRSRR